MVESSPQLQDTHNLSKTSPWQSPYSSAVKIYIEQIWDYACNPIKFLEHPLFVQCSDSVIMTADPADPLVILPDHVIY